jgi:hypothetical protein
MIFGDEWKRRLILSPCDNKHQIRVTRQKFVHRLAKQMVSFVFLSPTQEKDYRPFAKLETLPEPITTTVERAYRR